MCVCMWGVLCVYVCVYVCRVSGRKEVSTSLSSCVWIDICCASFSCVRSLCCHVCKCACTMCERACVHLDNPDDRIDIVTYFPRSYTLICTHVYMHITSSHRPGTPGAGGFDSLSGPHTDVSHTDPCIRSTISVQQYIRLRVRS